MRNEWENPEMSNKKTGGHSGFLPIFFYLFFARASGQVTRILPLNFQVCGVSVTPVLRRPLRSGDP